MLGGRAQVAGGGLQRFKMQLFVVGWSFEVGEDRNRNDSRFDPIKYCKRCYTYFRTISGIAKSRSALVFICII